MKRTVLKVLGGVVLLAFAGVFASVWASDRPVSALEARWAPPPSAFVEVDGMRVHVRDEGPRDDPRPIVLLHGTSASLHTWQGWVDALTPTRRVIRFDLPGFGLTGPRPDGDYRIQTYSRFVLAMLDRLGVQHAVIAGNSFGGYVGWVTALEAPERVSALVLVDSAGYPTEAQSMPIGFRIARNPVLAPLMKYVLPRGVVESSLRNTYGDPSRITPELVDRYYELTLREGTRTAVAERFRQVKNEPALSARIRELRVPTLILWGGKDRLIPPANAERFHQDIADSERIVFPELGHVPHEEDPPATVAAVRAFLARTGT